MIRVRALGACEIQIGRRRITLSTEMPFALGLYLCLRAGERLRRDEVARTFWGSRDPAKARHSLRQTLYRLRQKGLTLDEGDDELYLDPTQVESDVATLLADGWPTRADAASVEAAGDLLPGFARAMPVEFNEWLDSLRAQVAARHRDAALAQITQARREARWSDLERWGRHVLRTDPLNEEATFARAESAAMAGSKAAALEILDEYVVELGDLAPRIGLPATVLRRRIAERQPEWVIRGPREVPLVGRTEMMARLTGLVEAAARGEGSGVVLWGAPGVGKSRLAHEVASFGDLRGFRIIRVRSSTADSTRPLTLVLSLIRSLVDLPGAAGAHPSTLRVLDRVLRTHSRDESVELPPSRATDPDELIDALADLLDAIAAETRLFVLTDDIHHADESSQRTLLSLVRRTQSGQIFWLATSRTDLMESVGHAAGMRPVLRVTVLPLSPSDSASFISAVTTSGARDLTAGQIERIARAAGGIPLFLRELSLHHTRAATLESLPSTLQELIDARLSALPPLHTRILRYISMLGSLATVGRVRRLAARDSASLPSILESLEAEGIVYVSEIHLLAVHECWGQVVDQRTSRASRIALSHEVAESLLESPTVSLETDVSWTAAELFEVSGDVSRALHLYSDVGEQFYARGLFAEASRAFERALGAAIGSSAFLPIAARLARALTGANRLAEVEALCARAREHASLQSDQELIAIASLSSLRLEARIRQDLDHIEALEEVARIASDPLMPGLARQLACFAGLVTVLNDHTSTLEDDFYRWSSSATLPGVRPSATAALVALMYAAERGNEKLLDESEMLLEQHERETRPDTSRCRVLRIRSTAQRWRGNHQRAVELGSRAYWFAIDRGLLSEVALACELLCFTALDAGEDLLFDGWMMRWSAAREYSSNSERDHAYAHARARQHIGQKRYHDALACYAALASPAEWKSMAKRRAADLAALGYCYAMLDRRDECQAARLECHNTIASSRPTPQIDYVVEMMLRTLIRLGAIDEAARLRRDYLRRRGDATPFPVASGHTTLISAHGGL